MSLQQLTRAEEELMTVLWKLKEAAVRDILKQLPDPKPAYNTVSTVMGVLEKKGFVQHKVYGNCFVYAPKITERKYKKFAFNKLFNTYFDNSYSNLVSFLVEENKLSENEQEELINLIKKIKK